MLNPLIGDLFSSGALALVNPVNCVGVMGKGVALEFKKRFPTMFEDYVTRCAGNAVKLGKPYVYRDLSGVLVVNFPTKGHWRDLSHITDIERGLDYLGAHLEGWGIDSIAMPALGCGNGGLTWAEVGPCIYRRLHARPVKVEVYAPPGTPPHQLTTEFLSASSEPLGRV